MCSTFNINLNSRERVTSVNKQTLETFITDITILEIRDQIAMFIPQQLGSFFPNLRGLSIQKSKLKQIQKEDLAQFPNLRALYLHDNNIEVLPGDLFERNLELEWIGMENNPISHVDHNLLTPLKKLVEANFNNCNCIDKVYGSQSDIPSLDIDLKQNCPELPETSLNAANRRNRDFEAKIEKLNEIIAASHKRNTDLETEMAKLKETIVTSSSRIKKLEAREKQLEGLLEAATHQLFLSSSKNNFKPLEQTFDVQCKMDAGICEIFDLLVKVPDSRIARVLNENGFEVDTVTEVRIIDQQALFLPSNFAEKFAKATEISIEHSGLFQFNSDTFSNLTSLISLSIINNKIREIPSRVFTDNAKMMKCDLSGNNIEFIADNAFVALENLLELNLAHNLLTQINADMFVGLHNLRSLQLQHNNLVFLGEAVFASLDELSQLNISSEFWDFS
jgi:Leucine-rich repeat (LRR) protein